MYSLRKATSEDCASLARIQVDSFRTAYASFMPSDYLESFSYEEQEKDWREWLSAYPDDVLYVAVNDNEEVIGYALGRSGPSVILPYDSELISVHVRQAYMRQGIGRGLISAIARQLWQQGCRSLILWVIENNPARLLYEKLGGQLVGSQTITMGEDAFTVIEVAYGWPDITLLSRTQD